MPIPALGALTSLTGSGAFTPTSTAASGARSATGPVNVGGLTVPALSGGAGNLALAAVVLIAIVFIVRAQ